MQKDGWRGVLLAIAANSMLWCGSQALGRVEIIIEPGQPAPGMPEGSTFSLGAVGSLNADGVAAVVGRATGPGLDQTNSLGIWIGDADGLELAARTGSGAPGTAEGVHFSSFTSLPRINNAGETAFLGVLTGTGVTSSNREGIWTGEPGALELVARNGSPAPGTQNTFTTIPFRFVFNDLGQTAFLADLTGPTATSVGIWHGTAGALELLARRGSPAPGTGANFDQLHAPVLNASGQAAFYGTLSGPGIDAANMHAIWAGSPGDLQIAFRGGDQIPGEPAGIIFEGVFGPVMNNAGELAFIGATNDQRLGLWAGTPEHVQLAAGLGDQAPGTEPGVRYWGTIFDQLIGGGGHVAFWAALDGPGVDSVNNLGIFAGRPGEVQLVARRGHQAPGLAPGVNFAGFAASVMLNNAGVIAFAADLTGPGTDPDNSRGIWMVDPTGEAVLVVRAGDTIAGAQTSNFIMGQFGSGGQDGRASTFNDHGQLLYLASFTDGTQRSILYTPDLRWRTDTGGDWDDTANWTLSLAPAAVHDVMIDPAVDLTVAGPSSDSTVRSLSVGGGAGAARLNLQEQAKLTVLEELSIESGSTVTSAGLMEVSRLEIAGGGTLDLLGGEVLVGEQPFEDIAALIDRGYSGGTWEGDGITSSVAAGDPGRFTIVMSDAAEGTRLNLTIFGDANLDGRVDGEDFLIWQANFGTSSGANWTKGDFNGDGRVDGEDFLVWQSHFGSQLSAAITAVPEPSAAAVPLVAVLLLRRRRPAQ